MIAQTRPGAAARSATAGGRPRVPALHINATGRRVLRPIAVAAADVDVDVYCCVGVAHCFEKNSEGKLVDRMVIEPIGASSLECMANGARTSFKLAAGVRLGDALARNREALALPEEFQGATFCDKWDVRLEAAARTWQRPHAQDNLMDIVPLGKVRSNFNFSLEDKRLLNLSIVVTDDDNIKQDLSIDVYGRKDKVEKEKKVAEAAEAAAAKAAAEKDAEDDLDALLAG